MRGVGTLFCDAKRNHGTLLVTLNLLYYYCCIVDNHHVSVTDGQSSRLPSQAWESALARFSSQLMRNELACRFQDGARGEFRADDYLNNFQH